MTVNQDDHEVNLPEENPTIGLLLRKSAKKTVVALTLQSPLPPTLRHSH